MDTTSENTTDALSRTINSAVAQILERIDLSVKDPTRSKSSHLAAVNIHAAETLIKSLTGALGKPLSESEEWERGGFPHCGCERCERARDQQLIRVSDRSTLPAFWAMVSSDGEWCVSDNSDEESAGNSTDDTRLVPQQTTRQADYQTKARQAEEEILRGRFPRAHKLLASQNDNNPVPTQIAFLRSDVWHYQGLYREELKCLSDGLRALTAQVSLQQQAALALRWLATKAKTLALSKDEERVAQELSSTVWRVYLMNIDSQTCTRQDVELLQAYLQLYLVPPWSFSFSIIQPDAIPTRDLIRQALHHLWDNGEFYAVLTFATSLRDDVEVHMAQCDAIPGNNLNGLPLQTHPSRIFEPEELRSWLRSPNGPDTEKRAWDLVKTLLNLECLHFELLVAEASGGTLNQRLRCRLRSVARQLGRMGKGYEYLLIRVWLLRIWERRISQRSHVFKHAKYLLHGFSSRGSELGILLTLLHVIYPSFKPSLPTVHVRERPGQCAHHQEGKANRPCYRRVLAAIFRIPRVLFMKKKMRLIDDDTEIGRSARGWLSTAYSSAFESCGLEISQWFWYMKTTFVMLERPFTEVGAGGFETRCAIASMAESPLLTDFFTKQSKESIELEVLTKRVLAASLEMAHDFPRAVDACEAAFELAQPHASVLVPEDVLDIALQALLVCLRWIDTESSAIVGDQIVSRARAILHRGLPFGTTANTTRYVPDLRATFSTIAFLSVLNGIGSPEITEIARTELAKARQDDATSPTVLRATGYLLELDGKLRDAINKASEAYQLLNPPSALEQADHLVRQSVRTLKLVELEGDDTNKEAFLADAKLGFYESYGLYASTGRTLDATGSLCRLAEIHATLHENQRSLQVLDLMYKMYEEFRLETYGLPEYYTPNFHHSLVGDRLLAKAFSTAVHVCLLTGSEKAWLWSQRAKAQALSSLLDYDVSSSPHTPQRHQDDITLYAKMTGSWVYSFREQQALEEMQSFVDDLRSQDPKPLAWRLSVKYGFLKLAKRFKAYTRLADVLPMIIGGSIRLEDIRWMSMLPGADVAFVDWIRDGDEIWASVLRFDPTSLSEPSGGLSMFRQIVAVEPTYDSDDIEQEGNFEIHTSRLRLTVQGLVHLQKRLQSAASTAPNRDSTDYNDDNQEDIVSSMLSEVHALIEPILQHTTPETLLVLSPSTAMEGIPIHAIPIDDTGKSILLERNPIIYCPSYTVTRQCVSRSWQDIHRPQVVGPNGPTTFQQHPGSFICVLPRKGDQTEVSESFHAITDLLKGNVTSTVTSSLNPTAFADLITERPLIHYIGHASYANDTDPRHDQHSSHPASPAGADQALLLGRSIPGSGEHGAGSRPRNKNRLTPHDILTHLRLSNSPLVSLLACNSLRTHSVVGQEPVGILPSFLLAGASSVIGTLWKTDLRYAVRFSEFFYRYSLQSLASLSVDGERNLCSVLDVARVVRRVVLELRKEVSGVNGGEREEQEWGGRDDDGRAVNGRQENEDMNTKTAYAYYWAPFVLSGSWFRRWPWEGEGSTNRGESLKEDRLGAVENSGDTDGNRA